MTSDQLSAPPAQAPDAHGEPTVATPAGTPTPSSDAPHHRRWRLPVAILVIAAVLVGGWQVATRLFGDHLPAGVVAQVGGIDITQQQLDAQELIGLYQATINLVGGDGFQAAGLQLAPVEGDADACAQWIRKYAPEDQLTGATDAQLKAACQTAAANLTGDALGQLVSAQIDLATAPGLGAQIESAAFEDRLQKVYDVFGGEKSLPALTKATGITEADIRERLRQTQLNAAIEQQVKETAAKTTITDADLRRYYQENSGEFVTVPEKRDASLVVAATQAQAQEARQRIEAGESFADVAKDLGTKDSPEGGKYQGVASRDLTGTLRQLVFTAAKGILTGPDEVDQGWAVVRVDAITPQIVASFADSKEAIRSRVPSAKADWAWADYQKRTAADWLPKISCASEYRAETACGG